MSSTYTVDSWSTPIPMRAARLEAVHVLLEADVQRLDAVRPAVLLHHPEDQGRLHRPRRAGDEDGAPLRDAPAEHAIQTVDICLEKRNLRDHDVHTQHPSDEILVIKRC